MDYFKQNIIPAEVFVQLIAFLIVFWVLKTFAWKPILKQLEERRQGIRNEFDKITSLKAETEKLHQEYSTHLQKIEEEARLKIQDAIEEGRTISRNLQEKARAEAQATLQKTKDDLELEVAKARVELRREIAKLSVQVAEKIMQESLPVAKQQEKILEMIQQIEKSS